jgi:hypothetical protein
METQTYILKRLGVLSVAKILAAIHAFIGLAMGLFITLLISVVGGTVGFDGFPGADIGAVVILPLLYGAIGFVMGALVAFFFNILAGLVGGIEMTFASSSVVRAPHTDNTAKESAEVSA